MTTEREKGGENEFGYRRAVDTAGGGDGNGAVGEDGMGGEVINASGEEVDEFEAVIVVSWREVLGWRLRN